MTDTIELTQRMEALERKMDLLIERIDPIAASAKSMQNLKAELAPRINEAVRALIEELADVEADFLLEDLLFLIKKALRNTEHFNFVLEQLKSVIDWVVTAEPLLKTTIHYWIGRLDELEQKGLFDLLNSQLELLERLAENYTVDDLKAVNDVIIRLATVPARVDLARVKPAGPMTMFKAMSSPEIKQGMGMALELTRALGEAAGNGRQG